MSWSVNSFGKPEAVKAALAKQFENAKASTAGIPEEQAGVVAIEQLANAQLEFAAANDVKVVKVEASGSFYRKYGASWPGGCQTKLNIEAFSGFLE
jgi:hypothetical protein